MKKHNEGYTLPLVMVVLLVLAIVAVTIMTTSLKNMLRQQDFIEKMEDQYIAQGYIEKVVARLSIAKDPSEVNTVLSDLKAKKELEEGETGNESKKTVGTENAPTEWAGQPLIIWSIYGSVRIDCEIALEPIDDGGTIKGYNVKYSAYSISAYEPIVSPAVDPEVEPDAN